jgi:D-amino-acid oxidase
MSIGSKRSIAVIGSGVIGLTSAMQLLEQGFAVTIFAKATPPNTTSDVAAAFWAPFAVAGDSRMKTWALGGRAMLQTLAADPASGVVLTRLYDLADEPLALPYPELADQVERVAPGVFPAPWSGFCITVPRIDVPIYMPWLLERFLARGGVVKQVAIQSLDELRSHSSIIVNCSGLGAQALTGDRMYPIRGQVIRVRKPPGLAPDMIHAESAAAITYIIPRSQDCLLGGTFEYDDANMQVDLDIAAGILQRCAAFNPAFQRPDIIEHRVGLRPGRDQVRLEVERLAGGVTVIHNYGHGSIGHTLAWGCAAEVVALVSRLSAIS